MIIVDIRCGLGNQMFQYAFAYAISQKKNAKFKLDISSYQKNSLRNYRLGSFMIDENFASKEEIKKIKYENAFEKLIRIMKGKEITASERYYKESQFNFDKNIYETSGDLYFEGWWQSEKYFKEYRKDLLDVFTLKRELHTQSQIYKYKIQSAESICLHIRRGDYITNKNTNKKHGTCTIEYYENAILQIEKKIKDAHFFIFSDDLPWAKENIHFIDKITFVEFTESIPDEEEMYLMSLCKHNIIANSSFSWWGAWLNQNHEQIVVAPQKWFDDAPLDTRDIIPETWNCI